MKRYMASILLISMFFLLTGCLYPSERLQQNQISTGEYMVLVQNAVETFRQHTGVLPIKNSDSDTLLYEKYVVDFKKLLDRNMISRIPADAFEQGGSHYYVIVDPEEEMQVKLMDLNAALKIADIQRLTDSYLARGNPIPAAKPIRPHFYELDFEQLGIQREQVKSMYSNIFLPLIIHESGEILIDYAAEIMKALERKGMDEPPDPNQDLRIYLVEQSHFIPVSSYPYYWENGMPVISE